MVRIWILLGILAFLFFYGVSLYNRLVTLRNLVAEAWSSIDVMLKKRHNLISNLVETVKGYAQHERGTLEDVVKARSRAVDADSVEQQQEAENQLTSALGNLFALAEQYPDLKASTNFLQMQADLSVIEQDIERARRYYNGTVRDYNIYIEQFPSNLVAGMYNFQKGDFFELTNVSDRELPKVDFK